jgi:hypothetical protein
MNLNDVLQHQVQLALNEPGHFYYPEVATWIRRLLMEGFIINPTLQSSTRSVVSYLCACHQWDAVMWCLAHGADWGQITKNDAHNSNGFYISDAEFIVQEYLHVTEEEEHQYRDVIWFLLQVLGADIEVVPLPPSHADERLLRLWKYIVVQYPNFTNNFLNS